MDDERKEKILKIIHDTHTRGLDSVSQDADANDVIVALFNIVILAVQRTNNPQDLDNCVVMFKQMVDSVHEQAALEKKDEA